MKKTIFNQWFSLFLILLLALALRLYKINIPLADHHSWRQADTAAVARNFIKEGFDFFQPRIDNMTSLHIGTPNPKRLFLVEPPIYQTIVAGLYRVFGVQEFLARLVSIFFSLGMIIFLFLLVKELFNEWIGLLAAFFAAVLPYSIFYSRVILPEPMMLFTSMGMLYFFNRWLAKGDSVKRFIFALLFTSWSLALKTFPLFLALPMFYLVWRRYQFNLFRQKKLWLFSVLAILPFVAWRLWIARFPEGVPRYDWLFNQGGIRFRPAFFRWIFAERIGKLILGYWGLPLLVFGLILKPKEKEGWFFHLWLVSFFAYVCVLAAGNVTHDYYQIPFIPIAAVFLAKSVYWLLVRARKEFSRLLGFIAVLACVLFMLGFSWFEVRGFYLIQGGVDLAGQAVDQLFPKDALVLTGDSNDVTLLYNTNRYGWTGGYASYFPNIPESIENAKNLGATVYVTTKFEESLEFGQYMVENYPMVKRTNQYVIFSLESNVQD